MRYYDELYIPHYSDIWFKTNRLTNKGIVMLSALSKATDECKFRIPRTILDVVFIRRTQNWKDLPVSIDEMILRNVIRPRVMIDCNLLGGTEAFINLEGVQYTRTDDYTSVYRIPKTLTQGRSIIVVKNITFTDPTKISSYGIAAGTQNTTMLQTGSAVMDAHGSIPVTSTARVQLIGENVVMVRDTVVLPANIYLRCILENDETLSHLQLASYRHFSELCVLAVKAYIYNEYVIEMDVGELLGGMQLGRFKEIVDTYAEADELYRTYLVEKWQKVAVMQDTEQFTRLLRLMIGGSR
jgi:hypothetical protein